MKTTFTTFILSTYLLMAFTGIAQNTSIPDANFEQALIDLGYDSGTIDGLVPTANIDTITDLNISNKNIADLTGIEAFAALSTLNCADNQLSELNLNQNTNLTQVYCGNNLLTDLIVSAATNLNTLYCHNNQLEYINLRHNTALVDLFCANNQLTGLDLRKNSSLLYLGCQNNQISVLNLKNNNNTAIQYFDATSNNFLFCISVDDVSYSTANWTNIDTDAAFSTDCGYTYVPDTNFEFYLIDQGLDTSTVIDHKILTSNIASYNQELDVRDLNIKDLSGIEDFTSLTILNCSENQITSLDLGKNTYLTRVGCNFNNLSILNLSDGIYHSYLEYLECKYNLLTNLDLSYNADLKGVLCGYNQITNLDLGNFPSSLRSLGCEQNQITNLNLSLCADLDYLNISQNLFTSVSVSDNLLLETLLCENNQLTNLDVSNNTVLNILRCSENQLTNLDVSNNTALIVLWCSGNQLTNLDVSNNTALTNLNCSSNQLFNLDVSNNTFLDQLRCSNNQFTSLDVSNNIVLNVLDCSENQIFNLHLVPSIEGLVCNNNLLSNLEIDNNTNLLVLHCSSNLFPNLDVSSNTALIQLICHSNPNLTVLNVQNNNNASMDLKALDCPNLSCIIVDNIAYSTQNWTNVDPVSSFVLSEADCSNTAAVEDINASNEQLLITQQNKQLLIATTLSSNITKIAIYDILGKTLANQAVNQTQVTINTHNFLSNSILFIKVQLDSGEVLTQKIINY